MKKALLTLAILCSIQLSAQQFGDCDIEIRCEDIAKVFKCRIPPEQITGDVDFEVYQSYELCYVNRTTLSEVLQVIYHQQTGNSIPEIRYAWVPVDLVWKNSSHFDERKGCYVVTEFLKSK